jgi:hypothetical protein
VIVHQKHFEEEDDLQLRELVWPKLIAKIWLSPSAYTLIVLESLCCFLSFKCYVVNLASNQSLKDL